LTTVKRRRVWGGKAYPTGQGEYKGKLGRSGESRVKNPGGKKWRKKNQKLQNEWGQSAGITKKKSRPSPCEGKGF